MEVQVDKSHYDFFKYMDNARFNSFYYQLALIYKLQPGTILDIGPGNNYLKNILLGTAEVKTMDIDPELKPDVVGSVDNIPLEDRSFDAVCCFQVLEHLPFDKLETCLQELHRISKEHVFLSLPYSNLRLKFGFSFLLPRFYKTMITFPKSYKKNAFDGQHYWEIGRKGTSRKVLREKLSQYFEIADEFNPFENPYHIFYQLKKK